MIVFDTNVISEAIHLNCHQNVINWLLKLNADKMATTAVNVAELRIGQAILPDGKKKAALQFNTEAYIAAAFSRRVYPFDIACAARFAEIAADMKLRGCAISFADCQIAAIASVNNCAIATRDVRPFVEAGLQVVNPWDVTS